MVHNTIHMEYKHVHTKHTYIYTLFADIYNIKRDFCDLTVDSQFILIMSDPLCFKFVSKAMYCILNIRRCARLR